MNIKSECRELSELLLQIQRDIDNKNNPNKGRDDNYFNKYNSESVTPTGKKPRNQFKISLFYNVIPFLGIEGLLNLCLVNKEFSFFIKSVFTLRNFDQIHKSRRLPLNSFRTTRKNSNYSIQSMVSNNYNNNNITPRKSITSTSTYTNRQNNTNQKPKPKKQSSTWSMLSGMASYIGIGNWNSAPSNKISEYETNPKIIEVKVDLYEKILLAIYRNNGMTGEIKANQKEISERTDQMVYQRRKSMRRSSIGAGELLSVRSAGKNNIGMTDKDIEYIKYQNLESEKKSLQSEVDMMNKELESLKSIIKQCQQEDLKSSKALASMKFYLNSNQDLNKIYEDNNIDTNLKSGVCPDIDFPEKNLNYLAYYDEFKKIDSK